MDQSVANQKFLVGEDDEELSSVLQQTLHLNGIPVTVASSGAEAFQLASQGCYALMTIDYSLPHMTGDDLVLYLRNAGIEIFFHCHNRKRGRRYSCKLHETGARDYLVENDDLFRRVSRVVAEILDLLRIEEQLDYFSKFQ